jgi:tetratricopeptide (TPR) repeat protein
MNRKLCILSLGSVLAPCAFAQTAPVDRAEILGELAQGQSASYVARLVKSRGISFSPTADFLERVRLSGGEGILTERLSSMEPPAGIDASKNEHPFDRLAKCSELIHVGAIEQAEPECRAAVDENPQSAWPLMLLVRVLSESGITPEERVQLLRRAVAADANLISAHRALAMEEIPNAERAEEMQKVATLEQAQPASAFGAIDASIFDHRPSQGEAAENLAPEKQKQLRAYVETLLRDNTDLAAARLGAAFSYQLLGEPDNARAQIREALRLEPANPELHIALGHFYQAQHQVEAELSEYRTAVNLVRYQNLPHRYLGEALVREKRLDEAIQQWKDLLALQPRDLQASNSLITIYLDRQDQPAAIAELRRSLKASSDIAPSEAEFVDVRMNDLDRLGHLLTDDHQYEAAAQQYAYLLRFKPESSELHNNLGNVFYAQKRCGEAAEEYREAVRLDGDAPNAHQNLANCLLATKKTDEAIAEYQQALELDPSQTNTIAMLGVALIQKGELNAAIEQFQRYLEQDPKNTQIRTSLAHAHCLNKDYATAINELQQVLVLKPDFPAAENELARIYLTAEDRHFRNLSEGLRLARQAVQDANPPVPEFLDTLAEALLQSGDAVAALQTEEQAAKLAPDNAEIQKRVPHFREAAHPQAASSNP